MKKKKIDPVIEQFEEALKPTVSLIVEELKQPNNPLQNTKKLEHEVMDSLMNRHLDKYLEGGFHAINREMAKLCTPEEREEVSKEWSNALEHFFSVSATSLSKDKKDEEISSGNTETFQQLLEISDKTLEIFYKCGCRLFEQKHYQDAYNVFFIVSYLDYRRSNVWVALGLAAKRNRNNEDALKAFAQATLVNPTEALPQIYSAECYAENKEYLDAIASLKLAEEIAEKNPEHNSKSIKNTIRNLTQKYQTLNANKTS